MAGPSSLTGAPPRRRLGRVAASAEFRRPIAVQAATSAALIRLFVRSHRMRFPTYGLLALLLAAPLAQAQEIADAPAADASAAAPASASSSAPDDKVDLEDIRNFSRVYEVVRQAYV